MSRRGRIGAALLACALLLSVSAHPTPSEDSQAGHAYRVAHERLSDLKKTKKTKLYRSYWIDSARSFQSIEKKYPTSPYAGEACFERAGLYYDLYKITKATKDVSESLRLHARCQASYPKHEKAPGSLYQMIEIYDGENDRNSALKTYEHFARAYPKNQWVEKARKLLGLVEQKKADQQTADQSTDRGGKIGTVTGIRHWSDGEYTRVVIDLDLPFTFESHEFKNPDRLCFDIRNAHLADSLRGDALPINAGMLKQVRASQYDPNTVRVVLDVSSVESYVAFPLKNHDRLVIDVNAEDDEVKSGAQSPRQNGSAAKDGSVTQNQPAIEKPDEEDKSPKLSLSRQMGSKIKVIAIDAGHGGHDPGAIGRNGVHEKIVTLDIAKRLAVLVKERLGCKVVMTRDRDVFIPLDQRPAIARLRKADLFVSIHVNAHRKRKTRGVETYIQGLQASDREAMATAARENAMSTKSLSELDDDVDKILKDLKTDNKLEESLQLAWTIQNSLVDPKRPIQKQMVNLGVKRAFFYVLINTNIPSILAEVGFISNPDEEKLLGTPGYRQKVAEALYQGIKKYVEGRSPQMAGM